MIPTSIAPNMQVAPPVQVSLFTGQNADAALGRLPVVTVPPTISNPKVADNRSGQNAQRNQQPVQELSQNNGQVTPFSLSGTGELAFESPYSTTFVAQLFGQFQTSDASLGEMGGQSAQVPMGFVDFDRLSQFDITKYMPSFAFRPRIETPTADAPRPQVQQPQPQPQPVAAPVQQVQQSQTPESIDLRSIEPVSNDVNPLPQPQPQVRSEAPITRETAQANLSVFFSNGLGAYNSTQLRNSEAAANIDSRGKTGNEISLVL